MQKKLGNKVPVPRGVPLVSKFPRATNSYFDKTDWISWKAVVKNFYKSKPKCLPLFLSKLDDNRPYISVKILGVNITALLDSGSTHTVVGEYGIQFIRDLGITSSNSKSDAIETADKTKKPIVGVVDLPIEIKNSCLVIKAVLVPTLPFGLVFGCDFLKKYELLLDFKKNTWGTQNNNDFGLNKIQLEDETKKNSIAKCSLSENLISLFSLDMLSAEQRQEAKKVLDSFDLINSEHGLGRTNKIIMNIETGDAKPIRKKPYLMSPYMLDILNKELDDMLQLGVVEPANSPWCSPVLLVKKSNDEYRFVFDGRMLNQVTTYDSYPMANIDRILNSLRGANYISSIDLRKSFWQIPLSDEAKPKTAFSVVGRGQFQFKTVPFGLCNAAQTQQRLVDAIFGPRYEPYIFCYLDDIIVCSPTFEHHIRLLSEVRDRLKEANLTINIKKCEFFKKTLKFLGYIVGSNSLRTDPNKVSAMLNFPRPTTTTEIKRFIGLCSWYRRFIKSFSALVSPINDLLKGRKKGQSIDWSPAAEESFIKIKELLVSAPILCQPDYSKEFFVECDASNTGLGGVLVQNIDGEDRVIAYASRTLSRAERNYSVTERECLAVIFAIEKFRPWIDGIKFTVRTDHYSLLWLNNLQNPTGRLARWAVRLRQFSFNLVHRKGSNNVVPDFLSRAPPIDSPNDLSEVDHGKISSKFISSITIPEVSLDKIDPWYNNLRKKVRSTPNSYPQWKVENDFLLKFIPVAVPFSSNLIEWKYVVPRPQRRDIIDACHSPPTCSHLGVYKTLSRIKEKFYWPKMKYDVLKFIRNCRVCGSQKSSNQKPMGLMGKEKHVCFPFQTIAIDLMGPFPRSKKGNKWLLVVGDWFSKYVLLCSLRSSKSSHITNFLEKNVFLTYGVPQFIICDNGPQFISREFKNLAKKYQVQKICYNAVYSPQCNFVERINKTVGTAIRSYISKHDTWDVELEKIQFALNTSRHEITNHTPAFLVFARHLPISGKYYGSIPKEQDFEITPGNRDNYAADLKDLNLVFQEVRGKLHSAYERNSKYYNLRRRNISFNKGDLVWRHNKVLSQAAIKYTAKLAPRFVLSKVHEKVSNVVYELIDLDGTKTGRWHIKDMKPYLGQEDVSSDASDISE